MMQENKDIYDLAIVQGTRVHIIEKPFDFTDENFEQNSKFTAVPTEFAINFKLGN